MPDIKRFAFDNMEFISMLAHDMKTPIKAQIRALNLLYSGACGELSNEARHIILNIIASNKYLQCLTDNVLGDYRINRGIFVLNKTLGDIRKTIEESLCYIGILSEIKEQKVALNYMTDDFIRCYDEIEMQRVFINLLSNAFEYSKQNSMIDLNLKTDSGTLEFEIKSKSALSQPDENNTRLKAGTGLGLVVCRAIIEAHGGKITTKETKDGDFITSFTIP